TASPTIPTSRFRASSLSCESCEDGNRTSESQAPPWPPSPGGGLLFPLPATLIEYLADLLHILPSRLPVYVDHPRVGPLAIHDGRSPFCPMSVHAADPSSVRHVPPGYRISDPPQDVPATAVVLGPRDPELADGPPDREPLDIAPP